jgi:arsenate reductase-like glutaredoxin family protein
VSLLLEQPAILKRPIFVTNDGVSVGFDEAQKQNLAT